MQGVMHTPLDTGFFATFAGFFLESDSELELELELDDAVR